MKTLSSEVIDAIQMKALELYNRFTDGLKDEKGQTATEYVAVTAVGLLLAILIIWGVLGGALNTAITNISDKLQNFVSNTSTIP